MATNSAPDRFPHPFHSGRLRQNEGDPPDEHEDFPRTVTEMNMSALSWAIRQKFNWTNKIKDPIILAKWRQEAVEGEALKLRECRLSEKAVDYVLKELESYSKLMDRQTGIQHACDDRVFFSRDLVPDNLTSALHAEAKKLEDVPNSEKDWHPNSDQQVLDLVHPSLYPLVYRRSHSLQYGLDGGVLVDDDPITFSGSGRWFSRKYEWLPSIFSISKDGDASLVSPYINNIHPDNKGLINVIEDLVSAFIPLWEHVLGAIDRRDDSTRDSTIISSERPAPLTRLETYPPKCLWSGLRNWADAHPFYDEPDQEARYAHCPGDSAEERYLNWIRSKDEIVYPEVGEGFNFALEKNFKNGEGFLRQRKIAVIAKMANICLTPEKPEYPGGSWHVEGLLNERITSTGIYYYDSENITESYLSFRTCVQAPRYHDQDDAQCIEWLYGLEREKPLVQDRGRFPTEKGTCVAFPNIYQHCVSPFKLTDPTKPGHRKIVALFLCSPDLDPEENYSTSDIPIQREDWIREAVHKAEGFQVLAMELRDYIVDMLVEDGFLMTKEQAENVRLDLMKERSMRDRSYNSSVVNVTFNMCEH
ncbi:hypothetical protein DL96DRAFT_1588904 [Flagelloscypha sp. PMI_526]|nr:hypothetical protein DL96DRAFT_1588904 [Flagelloscypha sp. PMI_526]